MKRRCMILILSIILALASCGKVGTGDAADIDSDVSAQVDRSGFDWRTGAWKTDLSDAPAHTLYLGKYTEGLETEQYGDNSSVYRMWGNNLYGLDRFSIGGDGSAQMLYYINCYEGETGDFRHHQIPALSLPDYAKLDKTISTFDMVNEQEMVLFVQAREEGNNLAYLAIHMSAEGKRLLDVDVVDLQPVMQENGVMLEGNYIFDNIYVDSQGYYYVIPDEQKGQVLVLKPDGSYADRLEGRAGMPVRFAFKNPDGDPVFRWNNTDGNTLQLVGYEPGVGKKVYAEAKLPWDGPMAMTEDGYLYYGDIGGNLYRWDLYMGNREYCIDYGALGIGANPFTIRMIIGQEDAPVLLDYGAGSARIYCMGTDPQQQTAMIRLVSMTSRCDYISTLAIEFSRERGDYGITVEKPGGDMTDLPRYYDEMESFRDRAMMELATGKTADLYFVSAADMKLLYEKGVLADLTGVLPAEQEACIFPGVLAGGVIDGKQIGLAPEAGRIRVAMVSNDIWPEDSWSLEDAMYLMESNPQLRYLLANYYWPSSAIQMLTDVFLSDLAHSPFLNPEEGTCDFDNPLFVEILEHTKAAAGEYDPYGNWESFPWEDGTAAGFYTDFLQGFPSYTVIMAEYGDRYHPVGLPTSEKSGNYWDCEYFLVMSKDTSYREVLEEYLVELFDAENQKTTEKTVRNDLISQSIVYHDYAPDHPWQYDIGNGVFVSIEMKPDGSSWEQEYLDLMNSCVPIPNNMEEILNIIREEVASFYAGDKDADTVAGIIQNRVRLYLDEQN